MASVAFWTKKASASCGFWVTFIVTPISANWPWRISASRTNVGCTRRHRVEREAVGQAGLGQQLLGPLDVVGRRVTEVVDVGRRALGDPLGGRRGVAEHEALDDGLAVDGVAQRLAHQRVAELALRAVGLEVVRLDRVVDVDVEVTHALDLVDQLDADGAASTWPVRSALRRVLASGK